jgi:hypothetical protein
MRQPTAEEITKIKTRHEALKEAERAHRNAQTLYLRGVSALAEACDVPADALFDDKDGTWQFLKVVGQNADGKPIVEPLEIK